MKKNSLPKYPSRNPSEQTWSDIGQYRSAADSNISNMPNIRKTKIFSLRILLKLILKTNPANIDVIILDNINQLRRSKLHISNMNNMTKT